MSPGWPAATTVGERGLASLAAVLQTAVWHPCRKRATRRQRRAALWPGRSAAIIGENPFPTQESGTISKRKPPSQRAEQKKDETALAIARMREEAKAEKTPKPGRLASAVTKPPITHAETGTGHRMSNAAASSVRTKRQKSG